MTIWFQPKVIVHIDPLGHGDPIPFGGRGPPYVVIKVQPMPGALSRYEVTSNDPNDETENDIIHNAVVPARIVQTSNVSLLPRRQSVLTILVVHQYGLFKFSTGQNSRPTTPTANRSRAAIFGLDVISRNLFNSRPGVANDLFGGSTNSSRRTRTTASRSSAYTGSMSTANGSSMSRFSHTPSTLTAATSVDDEESFVESKSSSKRTRSLSRTKKLVKKSSRPTFDDSFSEPESSPRRGNARPISRSMSEPGDVRDDEDDDGAILHFPAFADPEDMDLASKLELAQRNRENQASEHWAHLNLDQPIDEDIYDGKPTAVFERHNE